MSVFLQSGVFHPNTCPSCGENPYPREQACGTCGYFHPTVDMGLEIRKLFENDVVWILSMTALIAIPVLATLGYLVWR